MDHPTEDGASPAAPTASAATRGPRGARGEIRRRITEAAVRSFADHGYDGASTRAIARDADCDPALVRYYFSTKQDLFEQVVRRPSALDDQLEAMAALPRAERAAYLAGLVERCWDDPETRDYWRSLLRTAATDDGVAQRVEDTWSEFVALGVAREMAAARARADGAVLGARGPGGGGPVPPSAGAPAKGVVDESVPPEGVIAVASITGLLSAVHLSGSRRAGSLSSTARSQALTAVLESCFRSQEDVVDA
ncbi:TetR/AcrR family transcriptional regulator [uncultured Pseudokineococcus sp.]|uniref:TetR/AcrR family transcriptional regulator n=1 Tax=uncultured Pseudokineococcus sp. TaxID=1642928 RepID=UPI0026342FB0|nr:TetR/AcrR family transcriptional regulator [uncultured Pseudokineococcus sp.]